MNFSVQIQSDVAVKQLKKMQSHFNINHIKRLNMKRAEAYRAFVIKGAKEDTLMLDNISEASKKVRGDHSPMYNDGHLVNHMKIRPMRRHSSNVSVGFFKDDPTIHPNSKVSMTFLAYIHHISDGYRIPLTGADGKAVRGWLWANELRTPTANFIHVKTRPFLKRGAELFTSTGADNKIVAGFVSQAWRF